jgi:predicted MFS family arabinose efflux permease
MRADLHWNYAQAGGLNTAIAVGYIAGAVCSAYVARLFTGRRAFVWSIAFTALTLVASGFTGDYLVLSLLRIAGGFATAITFVVGAGLVTAIDGANTAALATVYFGGVGAGTVISGVIVPLVLARSTWQMSWVGLGIAAALAVIPASWSARQIDEPLAAHAAFLDSRGLWSVMMLCVAYALFGAGSMSYMTFVIALLHQGGFGTLFTDVFFILLGLASTFGTPLVWSPILARLRSVHGIAWATGAVALSTLALVVSHAPAVVLLSGIVSGGSFLAVPTSISLFARRNFTDHLVTAAMAAFTVAFAVGQALGPFASGVLADSSMGLRGGFVAAAIATILASAIAPFQRDTGTVAPRDSCEEPDPMVSSRS